MTLLRKQLHNPLKTKNSHHLNQIQEKRLKKLSKSQKHLQPSRPRPAKVPRLNRKMRRLAEHKKGALHCFRKSLRYSALKPPGKGPLRLKGA